MKSERGALCPFFFAQGSLGKAWAKLGQKAEKPNEINSFGGPGGHAKSLEFIALFLGKDHRYSHCVPFLPKSKSLPKAEIPPLYLMT